MNHPFTNQRSRPVSSFSLCGRWWALRLPWKTTSTAVEVDERSGTGPRSGPRSGPQSLLKDLAKFLFSASSGRLGADRFPVNLHRCHREPKRQYGPVSRSRTPKRTARLVKKKPRATRKVRKYSDHDVNWLKQYTWTSSFRKPCSCAVNGKASSVHKSALDGPIHWDLFWKWFGRRKFINMWVDGKPPSWSTKIGSFTTILKWETTRSGFWAKGCWTVVLSTCPSLKNGSSQKLADKNRKQPHIDHLPHNWPLGH